MARSNYKKNFSRSSSGTRGRGTKSNIQNRMTGYDTVPGVIGKGGNQRAIRNQAVSGRTKASPLFNPPTDMFLTNMYIAGSGVTHVTYNDSEGILPYYVRFNACHGTCANPGNCLYWLSGGFPDGIWSSDSESDDGEMMAPIPENSLPQTYTIGPEWINWFEPETAMHLTFTAYDPDFNSAEACVDYVTEVSNGGNDVCNTGLGPCLTGNCTDHEYDLYCCYFSCGGGWCANYECSGGLQSNSGVNKKNIRKPRGKNQTRRSMTRGGRVNPRKMKRGGRMGRR